ncbi:MAG: TlpA family protein disulfide reductase [Algoriphagus sp.]|jgi:thiol-disulfide isomerase/thioredoxin|uniref:TlpA family protein disulfide reductase n=2 Tax=Algoriphagus sp. TaxID=1872435 RepID=UPI0027539A32|nr:TlpA family protein disulfide reductase [Algoriphagus sp.]
MKSTLLSNPRQALLGLLLGSFLFLGSCQSKNPSESKIATEELSSNRASARFQLANGEEFGLQLENKKWTVLHFWATWCKPCLAEFPELKEALPNLQQTTTQFILASEEELGQIQSFESRHQTGLNLSRFVKGSLADFEVYALPTTVVLDTEGKEVFRHVGLMEWKNIKSIEELIQIKP